MSRSCSSNQLIQSYSAHTGAVSRVAWHPSGNFFVTSSLDSTLKIWDVREGQLFYTLHGHEGAIYDCCFSPAGDFFASAGCDEQVSSLTRIDRVFLASRSWCFSTLFGRIRVSESGCSWYFRWLELALGTGRVCLQLFTWPFKSYVDHACVSAGVLLVMWLLPLFQISLGILKECFEVSQQTQLRCCICSPSKSDRLHWVCCRLWCGGLILIGIWMISC